MNLFKVIIIVALALTLTACVKKQEDIDNVLPKQSDNEIESIQGYIVFLKDSDRPILIRDENFTTQDINLTLEEIQDKYKDIMFLIVDERPNTIKSGQKVELEFSKIMESYPPQVVVTKIERIDH